MTTTSPAPRGQRLGHDARRQQILDCARTLFAKRTYASVSTAEIAHEAGIARGLLHHYFGTKRELYLEVVRELMRTPAGPFPPESVRARRGRPDLESLIDEGVRRWLTMLERNRGMWLATVGGSGLGRDAEVEAILERAREQAADRLIQALGRSDPARAPGELRALVRAYSGYAEAASLEWLERRRLDREQIHALLVEGFLRLVRDVLPVVERAGRAQ